MIPRTAQQGQEMQNFIEANQADLVGYIVQTACPAAVSAVAGAAGVPVPPQVSGILCTFIGNFVNQVIDKCKDPAEKNRRFRKDFNATLEAVAANVPKLPPPPLPREEELPLLRWAQATAEWEHSIGRAGHELEETWSGSFSTFLALAPLVLPSQTQVSLSWFLSAGAGGLCEQDMALVKLLGPDGELFAREVEGVYKVGQSESRSDSNEVLLGLPAGSYLLVAAVSGPSGHADLMASYTLTEVSITETIGQQRPPSSVALMAIGAWLLLTGGRR